MSGLARRAVAVGFVVVGAVAGIVTVVAAPPADRVILAVLVPAFVVAPVVGGLILVRQPNNRIGWLFCLVGLGLSLTMGLGTATAAAVTDNSVPTWALLGLWVGQWAFLVFVVPGGLLMMTFPTGRLPSRRWRWVAVAFVIVAVASGIGSAFGRPILEGVDRRVANPFLAPDAMRPWLLAARDAGDVVVAFMIIPIAASIVARFRRSVGIERLQLKWFAFAVAALALFVAMSTVLPPEIGWVGFLGIVLGFGAALPAAAGLAILRYRLYDIDVVIRRTLVYGVVVAVLGALYVGLVLALQLLLSGLTGSQTLPVALSTLAIAALFGPVRARVRAIIDRRFYRSRYDAQRTLEAFSGQLRDQVELEAVGGSLVDTARRAVQPSSAGIWVRGRTSP